MASRKKRATESVHDRDRIIVRLPKGMRDDLAALAEANGRSVTSEVVAALERHLKGVDRVTQLWTMFEQHRADIEGIGLIRNAVLNLESWMGRVTDDSDFDGLLGRVLADNKRAAREAERLAKLPPISAEQAAHIRALIKETDAPEDLLLRIFKVSSIEEIKDFDRVVQSLEHRRSKNPPAT